MHEETEMTRPTMIMLLRHPGGRTGWKFENKLHHDDAPCDEYEVAAADVDYAEFNSYQPPNLAPIETVPPGVNKIPNTRADYSIPEAEEVAETAEVQNLKQINQIRSLLEEQIKRENDILLSDTTRHDFTKLLPPPPGIDY